MQLISVFYGLSMSEVTSVLAYLAVSVLAFGAPQERDALATLQQQFGTAIESTTAPVPRIRFCPDNTCEAFTGARGSGEVEVADFALLFLWGVSQYTDLDAWHKEPLPASVAATLERRAQACPSRAEYDRLACALRALAKASHITVSFVRYDEGAESVEKVDLEQALGRLK